ncbi:leucine-rich repeats and immunoglobulin-like domains protein 3 isoform X1 [Diachasma alloeum]|uniref:leucine-rich repeats and immunoglobulin-like domains protein 3 isoform X1 n=1 Tax=Diachasma alloeum TaxID=454923 RepID=UPI000738352A|nr:leucine-rich repeats and immunoglobulin-like domains protein 3 isoform X1 [Diachasma alloeum]
MSTASSEASPLHYLSRKTYHFVLFAIIVLLSHSKCASGNYGDPLELSGKQDVQCPVECACLGNTVVCSGLQLIAPPSGLPPWTEILELKENSITNLESDAFLHLHKLRELDISSNKLQNNFTIKLPASSQLTSLKVNKNSLDRIPDLGSLENLTHLSLSHNDISSVNGSALKKLEDLQSLDVAGNRIKVLRRGSFHAGNHLVKINLNINQLEEIEVGAFDNLTLLEELRINKNSLTLLNKHVFSNLGNLKILELNRNELQQIPGLCLKNLTNLQELRLKRNKIDTIDDGAFWPLKTLLTLQLDFNALSVVRKGALFGLDGLRKLTLSHNKISTIEPQAWEQCKQIQDLDLSNNKLVSIERGTFEYLTNLERLKIDHNKISFISEGAFGNTPNLRTLDLNNNKISDMIEDITGATGAFVSLNELSRLGLAFNQIKSINRNAFVGLKQLDELDLLGNNITSIQENAFTSMPRLSKLKMNTIALVCDCGLQWLSVWLRNNHYNDAKVRCGYPHWLKGMHLTQLQHANFTCDEFPKPRITEEPSSQMGIKGGNVTLTCKATSSADTPLHFTWKHENVQLSNGPVHIEENSKASDTGVTEAVSILHLINVTHANAGRYQCMVSNTYGTSYSAKAKISVLIYPSFLKIPRDIRVTAGSTARLECSAEGHPSPQIAWQKDGGNDFPAARERRMHMMPTDPVLFIVDVKTADSGVYSCTAQNMAGVIVANATLTILETPSFVKPMENKEIAVGGSVVLECMASGSPRPKLSWRKNGSPLQATVRHFFTAEDQLLIIVSTEPNDAGTYECEMSNSLGSVVGASRLTVKPAPSTVVNEDDVLGLIIITVVCCAVGTSIVWVVIIYQTRRHLNISHGSGRGPGSGTPASVQIDGTTTQLYLDSSSQHSKDSGTGDSTNPSSDQLQLCLPEEMGPCIVNTEDEPAVTGEDPLLRYTNHQRNNETDSEDMP